MHTDYVNVAALEAKLQVCMEAGRVFTVGLSGWCRLAELLPLRANLPSVAAPHWLQGLTLEKLQTRASAGFWRPQAIQGDFRSILFSGNNTSSLLLNTLDQHNFTSTIFQAEGKYLRRLPLLFPTKQLCS